MVESVRVQGVSTLKSFDPPLSELKGLGIEGVTRRGKHLLMMFDEHLVLLIHLMSAGRLQVFDKPASAKDRTSRLLIQLTSGREVRLREFGTKQSAWAKLLREEHVESEEMLATLGPEAWPDPPEFSSLLVSKGGSRPLHTILRDQRVIAGIGRSWVDELLHCAMLSPFKRGSDLTAEEAATLRNCALDVLGGALQHYEKLVKLPIPDKFPMPLKVHGHQGEPCPRCGSKIEAVFFEDHVMCYCPRCQTGGKPLKDRRLSRLLK